jgi:site-specific DNA-methyltransferase (adenine-specific)/adenine-specific DNA-methyltransferase
LNWIGKEAVVNHHQQVPFHLLKDVLELSCGDPGSGNLIVQGDNLVALKSLLPYYAGQVKCIYIDPPYNTGNENWVYNDNVNSPVIREWLGKVVGGEGETLDRHDRWLCMMYPRLSLLRQFLCEEGAIFISIDDNEMANVVHICDEIFGERNRVLEGVWIKRVSPANDAKQFSSDHEFIIVYARNKDIWRPTKLLRTEKQLENYRNPDNDPRGPWNSVTYTCNKTADERPNLYHGITNPNTGEVIWPRRTAVWKYDAARHLRNAANGSVWWGEDGKAKMPRLKRFLSGMGGVVPRSFFHYDDAGHTQEARTEILSILPGSSFTTPKATRLIERIIQLGTQQGDLILDSFAGSGTTGQAVLQLNKQDGGNRRFMLVEMEPHIAKDVTAERVRRVAQGYTNTKGEEEKGLGGGFRYCELGDPIFDAGGKIRPSVTFGELARHVFFTETGRPLPRERVPDTPFIEECNGVGVYLLYNGVLKDRSANGGNILNRSILASLPPFDGQKVIYCAGNLLGAERLQKERVIIKQTPYEIKAS